MTRNLILVRHAKSSWKTDDPDHDRPLNKRGRKSARAIGDWLRTHGHLPDQVLTSSSARTLETLELMALGVTPDVSRALYGATANTLLAHLREAGGQSVLMLGHNPGIAEFAERLAKTLPEHRRFLDYPTCATTVFRFDLDDWSELRFGTGKVLDFVIPRELV